jgi:steroid 5-alpha reductase family enzyme
VTVAATLGLVWLCAAIVMTAGWLWQYRHCNAGIVDVLWAASLAASALALAALGRGAPATRAVLALCGGLWGARLAVYLWSRVRGAAEDGRYLALRTHWNGSQVRFFLFFQLQALLVALFALPFLAVAGNPTASPGTLAAALLLFVVSIAGESLADRQLQRFRARPENRGRTCREGLWRYSRHPNYFFEWLHWFTYVLLARGAPLALLSWAGPAVMLVFLRYLSGIPFTEAQALRTRGDSYRDYQRSTPMLIPWFPRPSAPERK